MRQGTIDRRFPIKAIPIAALVAAVVMALLGVVAAPAVAAPSALSGSSLPPNVGVDVSFPQCSGGDVARYPARTPFAVVGVNGGLANKPNPCFLGEYEDAVVALGGTTQPKAAVYLNTGDPALLASWWPTDNETQTGLPSGPSVAVTNPYGTCAHLAGAACAYVYGYSMARADYLNVQADLATSPRSEPVPTLWWLDVETSNTWQTDTVANSASIQGMADYLGSNSGATAGLYSTSYQWKLIAGTTPASSSLAGLPSWLAGATLTDAAAACADKPLTPAGQVGLVQYVTSGLDNDYSCAVPSVAAPTLSDVSAASTPTTAVPQRSSVQVQVQAKTNASSADSTSSAPEFALTASGSPSLTAERCYRELDYRAPMSTLFASDRG